MAVTGPPCPLSLVTAFLRETSTTSIKDRVYPRAACDPSGESATDSTFPEESTGHAVLSHCARFQTAASLSPATTALGAFWAIAVMGHDCHFVAVGRCLNGEDFGFHARRGDAKGFAPRTGVPFVVIARGRAPGSAGRQESDHDRRARDDPSRSRGPLRCHDRSDGETYHDDRDLLASAAGPTGVRWLDGGRRRGPRFPPSLDPLPRPRPDDLPLPSHVADRQRRGGARGEPCGQPRRRSCLAGRRSGRQRLGLEPGRVLEDRFEIRNVRGALLQTRREGSGEVRDLVRPDRGELLPQGTLPRLSEVVADKQ